MTDGVNLIRVAVAAAGGTSAVADMLGVHPTTVSRYISGRINVPSVSAAATCAAGGDVVSVRKLLAWISLRQIRALAAMQPDGLRSGD